jgi:hypothetical protein
MKAKFADAETDFGSYRRPEGAAGQGARRIQVAGSCSRVESGAGFIVGKVFESVFSGFVFRKNSGCSISWKFGR